MYELNISRELLHKPSGLIMLRVGVAYLGTCKGLRKACIMYFVSSGIERTVLL